MRRGLKIILVTNSLILLAGTLLGPIYAIFVEEIGGDILTVGYSFAVFSIVAGVVVLLIGKLEDRLKKKGPIIVIGYLVMALGFYGYLFVKNPIHLFVVQGIIGLGEALYIPALIATYDKLVEEKNAAFQWGAWEGIYYIIAGVAAFLGAWIVNDFGFTPLFILMGSLCVISALGMYILPKKFLKHVR